jgi:UDP-N-acetylmuramoyl-tripeptide--D-alanyl-D-alanine ligase
LKIQTNLIKQFFQASDLIGHNIPSELDLHVVIDSRLIKPGDVFVCIRGENVDGHNYINNAVANGAVGFMVNRKVDIPSNCFQIVTSSPETSMQIAAKRILKENQIKQIAITGSAGKTTTKDLLSGVMNSTFPTSKTIGNYNTPIGVPISIINMDSFSHFFVCELSASYPGEIDQNLSFLELEAAIITGIGSSHLEFFGNIESIFNEKMKITKSIRNQGPLIINGDQEWGRKAKKLYSHTTSFGFEKDNDITAFDLQRQKNGTSFQIRLKDMIIPDFFISTLGEHFILDSLPSIFLAFSLGVPIEKIKKSIASFQAEKGRGRIIKFLKNTTLIDESYNANPYSFKMSLGSFIKSRFTRKIAVIGDMLELGDESYHLHEELGKWLRESDIKIIIYKGQFSKAVSTALLGSSQEFYPMDSLSKIEDFLLSILQEGDGVFIKASNGVGLHTLVAQWEKRI